MTDTEGAGEHVRNALMILRETDPRELSIADVAERLHAADLRLTAAAARLSDLRALLSPLRGDPVADRVRVEL